ncbi:class I SAM-dependent methyltransferase [Brucella pseudogrignonensis]|jgi:ubiquinone/menaquinone biosynthesis C-methylase UbiE|uniref:class I SAM-dependent methyltransferase n=1 Tax=Brucella pseudogrignonensis TaxID=419475 RepID=UPI0038D1A0B7
MFEILEAALGDGFSVIDAACGPGSLALRLLERFRRVKVVAVDIDPVLLEIARVASRVPSVRYSYFFRNSNVMLNVSGAIMVQRMEGNARI